MRHEGDASGTIIRSLVAVWGFLLDRHRIPIATIGIASSILILNGLSLAINQSWAVTADLDLGSVLKNTYRLTLNGEFWRPFTSWIPHADSAHLAVDVLYLLLVGTICETRFGPRKTLLLFFVCNWIGSWFATFFDPHYQGLVGSSDGTHGLAAYYCLTEGIWLRPFGLLNTMYLLVYGMLLYMACYAVVFGTIPWPFDRVPNGGVDHLGGIGAASVWVVVAQRHRKPCIEGE